ncbi:ANTAR domain-containing response regulator [Nocardia otitidiscaviarum]|uniref:ANTAR domain-containing response regulator n=1 Tax=Nocardia otitidiscaviarum TaxID=1823 RepID=UPI002453CD27|nr:GAF and ANTAR domain-containing protein [Nocardia otitidiscaviarum]
MNDVARPDPLLRLGATSTAIRALRDVFAIEEPLDAVLGRVAAAAAHAIPDADAVTITVIDGDTSRTAACTDDTALELDRRQYDSGRGPGLEAARTSRPVRAHIGIQHERWPEFDAHAQRLGVRAYLSVPLLEEFDDHEQLIGSLNVYSYTATAFDPFDEGLMQLYTAAAGQAILNARNWAKARETVTQLEQALTSRADIDQAKGVLMAIHGCTADEAFDKLATQSQHTNTKVHTLARQLLDSLRATPKP